MCGNRGYTAGRRRRREQPFAIIAELEVLVEMQARTVRVLATRLAELGDTVTGRDEIAEADEAYRRAIGGDEWPE